VAVRISAAFLHTTGRGMANKKSKNTKSSKGGGKAPNNAPSKGPKVRAANITRSAASVPCTCHHAMCS
jgi:hypothetical protein